MPTVLRIDGYRFFFFSDEHLPLHIHVEKAECYLRVELENLKLTNNYGFSSKEVQKIVAIIEENRIDLIGAWNEYFNQKA
ncbi:MAG: DUF4160 domain-containing protein [Sulfurospirillum sp.]|jgi:hypothetical protein|nr:DUF4160 domain-containing protein [Sulfurospirillum sp.]